MQLSPVRMNGMSGEKHYMILHRVSSKRNNEPFILMEN